MHRSHNRVGLLCALLTLWALPAHADPPNIILVVFDDATACWFGDYTTDAATSAFCSEAYETPTMDALADSGVMVPVAWAQPVCSPFRASMMTGTNPREHGVGTAADIQDFSNKPSLNAARPNLARSLEAGGYTTYLYGKAHMAGFELGDGLATHPSALGFSFGRGSLGNLDKTSDGDVGGDGYTDWQMCNFVTGVCDTETTYATTFTIDDAELVLNNAEPWFMSIQFNAPHSPFHAPPPGLITNDEDCNDIEEDDTHVCFNRAIEAADTELGRLIAHGDYDPTDTVIIVTADNGTPFSIAVAAESDWEAGRCKSSVGECGLWVPLIASGAGVGSGTADILVQASTDLYATILDIAGIQQDASGFNTGSFLPSLGGQEYVYRSISFWPNLQDPALASPRSCLYAERFRFNSTTGARESHHEAMRTATHKLMRHLDDGEDPAEEFFLTSAIREAVGDRQGLSGDDYDALVAKMDLANTGGDPCR